MRLFVVGIGVKNGAHLTLEAKKVLEESDKVFYLANHEKTNVFLEKLNKNSFSLRDIYFSYKNRNDAYRAISEKIISEFNDGMNISFAIYGHPTFFVQPSLYLSDEASHKGVKVHFLPGLSSLDCLLSDLKINPGSGGMQILDCTELLLYKRKIDVFSHVVLMQPFMIGNNTHERVKGKASRGLVILKDYLQKFYMGDRISLYIYRASRYPLERFRSQEVSLEDLPEIEFDFVSTIYLPPQEPLKKDSDMAAALKGIYGQV